MSQNGPNLGQLITGDERRDAVHIAVAPAVAAEALVAGQHVGFVGDGLVGPSQSPIGIVGPFLRVNVCEGQRFWLFLYPNTITSLRHVWTHPAFTPKPPNRQEAR